ncbi:MAG TPA: twin-arginine translocase TatA/TatE family subunit [Bryobacteraceae bacterium]|jgi:sec-independent protein translocase protein TatA|nr:twin-arginine translocase TatA/TatE family subunit [Bryobacteraceae bacterium]
MFRTIGPMELVVIVIVFLLLFGGKKLGDLGKGLGEGIKHFKSAIKDDEKDDKSKP